MPNPPRRGKSAKSKKMETSRSNEKRTTGSFLNGKLLLFSVLLAGSSALYYWYYSVQYPRAGSGQPDTEIQPKLVHESVFNVIEIPGKGKGAIATRNIKQGEVVLREYPLFVVLRNIQENPAALIIGKVQQLNPQQQQAFRNLSYVNFPSHLKPEDHLDEVALAIFQTNAVSAGENVGIFPRMARINHGCSSAFNVVYNWRDDEKILVVHALKNIQKGQELLTTYYDSKKPRDERRAYLSQQYGFHCTCDVCSLPDDLSKASDRRLAEISRLYGELATWSKGKITGAEALTLIRKIWRLEDEEGYWSERGQLAADAALVAASHSDAGATQAWASRAAEWYSYEIGADTSRVRQMESVAASPQSHAAWGAKNRLSVGGLD